MGRVRHGCATTTHAVTAAPQRSQASLTQLSRELGSRCRISRRERFEAEFRASGGAGRPKDRHQHCHDFSPKRPEVGQDHAHVVAAAAQDGMERITERTFQAAAGETAVSFLMALIMC
jgi:hypothetical protein